MRFNKTISLISLGLAMLFLNTIYAQQNDLNKKAQELIYSNPDEAIKIAEHVLKSENEPQGKAIANLLLSKSYLVKGDYNKAVIFTFNDVNNKDEVSTKTKIEINILKSELLRKLYLDKESQKYLLQAKELVNELTNDMYQTKFKRQIVLERIRMQLDRRENSDALKTISDAEKQFKEFLNVNSVESRAFYLAKVRALSAISKLDSAAINMNRTMVLLNSAESNNLYEKAHIFKELGLLYLKQQAIKESEEALFIALRFAQIIDNPVLLMQTNRDLAINYLAAKQENKHKVYNDEFLILNNQVALIEQEAVNSIYNIISKQEEDLLVEEKNNYNNKLYIVFGGVFLLLLLGISIILKIQRRKGRLNEIIMYLELSRNQFKMVKPKQQTKSKRIVITKETENNILLKLKRFENSNKFLSKDMSLAYLSGHFETNTKYLSEIINKHYDDNFNTFINKLRINHIIGKLKNEPNYHNYKISVLADESGYSSHSSFTTVFKSIVGMSPTTFIDLVKEEREALKKNNQG